MSAYGPVLVLWALLLPYALARGKIEWSGSEARQYVQFRLNRTLSEFRLRNKCCTTPPGRIRKRFDRTLAVLVPLRCAQLSASRLPDHFSLRQYGSFRIQVPEFWDREVFCYCMKIQQG